MRKYCQEVGDTMESLKDGLCSQSPKCLSFGSESGKENKDDTDTAKARVLSEMEKANQELKRLQILKALEVERQRLAELLARKEKCCSLFA